jgi:hypothetical protein
MATSDTSIDPFYFTVTQTPTSILTTHINFVELSIQVLNLGSAQYVYVGTPNVQNLPLQLNDIYRKTIHGNCHFFDGHDIWVKCDIASPTPPIIAIYGELYFEGG